MNQHDPLKQIIEDHKAETAIPKGDVRKQVDSIYQEISYAKNSSYLLKLVATSVMIIIFFVGSLNFLNRDTLVDQNELVEININQILNEEDPELLIISDFLLLAERI